MDDGGTQGTTTEITLGNHDVLGIGRVGSTGQWTTSKGIVEWYVEHRGRMHTLCSISQLVKSDHRKKPVLPQPTPLPESKW